MNCRLPELIPAHRLLVLQVTAHWIPCAGHKILSKESQGEEPAGRRGDHTLRSHLPHLLPIALTLPEKVDCENKFLEVKWEGKRGEGDDKGNTSI